jgi:hypothetical protein
VTLSACATPRGATPTSAPPVAESPSPTPAEEATLVVGPGDEPPRLFDGDCENMLSDEQVSTAIGRDLVAIVQEGSHADPRVANVGGLTCLWDNADGVHVVVTAFPAAALAGTDLTTVGADWTAADCDWYCAVISESGDVVVATTINGTEVLPGDDAPSAKIAALGDQIAATVATNAAAREDEPWQRDLAGWRSVSRCDALADAMGNDLSLPLSGEVSTRYIDLPLIGGLVGDAASRSWTCSLTTDAGVRVLAWGHAGGAWSSPVRAGDPANTPLAGLPAGWEGVLLPSEPAPDGGEGPSVALTDGVNDLTLYAVPADFGADPERLAAALATAFPDAAD